MQLVGAALGGGDDDAARRAAIFGGVIVRHHLDLFHRLHRRIEIDLPGAQPHVLARAAVDPEHLALRAAAGDAEVGVGITRRIAIVHKNHGAGSRQDVQCAAVAQRQIRDAARIDDRRNVRAAGIHQRRLFVHVEHFADGADLHLDVEAERLAGAQDEAFTHVAAKSLVLDGRAYRCRRRG